MRGSTPADYCLTAGLAPRLLWCSAGGWTPEPASMPRVLDDQRAAFDTDEVLVALSENKDVKYTGALHSPNFEERKAQFIDDCQNGRIPITYPHNGINLILKVPPPTTSMGVEPPTSSQDTNDYLHISSSNEVQICSRMIFNGVCVRWRGHINRQTLEGRGRLEYDQQRALDEAVRHTAEMQLIGERFRQLQEQFAGGVMGSAGPPTGPAGATGSSSTPTTGAV